MATPAKKLKMDMDVLARSVMTVYVCHNVNSIRIIITKIYLVMATCLQAKIKGRIIHYYVEIGLKNTK